MKFDHRPLWTQVIGRFKIEDMEILEKLVYLHFFLGGNDWYVTEYDPSRKRESLDMRF